MNIRLKLSEFKIILSKPSADVHLTQLVHRSSAPFHLHYQPYHLHYQLFVTNYFSLMAHDVSQTIV